MQEPDQEIYVKAKAKLHVATYAMLCDSCRIWIEKGEECAKATFNEYDSCEFDIVNCKDCLIRENLT